jgi:hypothetical protein
MPHWHRAKPHQAAEVPLALSASRLGTGPHELLALPLMVLQLDCGRLRVGVTNLASRAEPQAQAGLLASG